MKEVVVFLVCLPGLAGFMYVMWRAAMAISNWFMKAPAEAATELRDEAEAPVRISTSKPDLRLVLPGSPEPYPTLCCGNFPDCGCSDRPELERELFGNETTAPSAPVPLAPETFEGTRVTTPTEPVTQVIDPFSTHDTEPNPK